MPRLFHLRRPSYPIKVVLPQVLLSWPLLLWLSCRDRSCRSFCQHSCPCHAVVQPIVPWPLVPRLFFFGRSWRSRLCDCPDTTIVIVLALAALLLSLPWPSYYIWPPYCGHHKASVPNTVVPATATLSRTRLLQLFYLRPSCCGCLAMVAPMQPSLPQWSLSQSS